MSPVSHLVIDRGLLCVQSLGGHRRSTHTHTHTSTNTHTHTRMHSQPAVLSGNGFIFLPNHQFFSSSQKLQEVAFPRKDQLKKLLHEECSKAHSEYLKRQLCV